MHDQMPRPGPHHEILAKLAGKWAGDETLHPSAWSPTEQQRHGTIDARVFEGFFVVSDYEQRSGDEVSFRGHGVYSWCPNEEKYVMYWFDSMGGAGGVAKGDYEGNRLTFRNTSPFGHHMYRYTFERDHTLFEMKMSADGENWNTAMSGHYRPM